MPKLLRLLVLASSMPALSWLLPGSADPPRAPDIRLRRPVALQLTDGGKRLLVGNRDSGTIAVLDTQRLQVVAETRIGRRLSDLVLLPRQNHLLATDEAAGELIVLAYRAGELRELRRLKVGSGPVSVRIGDGGKLATVACLWPRQLVVVDLAGGLEKTHAVIDLPFAPRCQLPVPGTFKVLVADAFAGKLAVVDLRQKKIESLRDLAIHNIRGLALDRSGKHVWLTHQMLNPRGHTTAGDIRTSNVITNHVHKFSLAAVLDPSADVLAGDLLYPLGDVEQGAGDPAQVAENSDGHVLVTFAGVNELAIGRPREAIWTRLAVGRRPTALAVDTNARRAYVANTFADSISVVDLQVPKVIAEVRV